MPDDMTITEKPREIVRKEPFHKQVANRLIEQIKTGTAPWQKPWTPGIDPTPINPVTGKHYRGSNDLWLRMSGRSDPRWMTYNQANKAGYKIRKGEKGMPVQKWIMYEERTKLDENKKPVIGEDGKPEKIRVQLSEPYFKMYTVFNGEQIEGIPPLQRKDPEWDPVERAESIINSLNFEGVVNDTLDRAYYSPYRDEIHMPDRASFPTAEAYYDTLLHEAAHGTGHESRLKRDMTGPFGTDQYAREELRAEIASMMINGEIGIEHNASNNAAYVNSWVRNLENHPMEILRAAADADKIRKYVFERERELHHSDEQILESTLSKPLELTDDMVGKFEIRGYKEKDQEGERASFEILSTTESDLSQFSSFGVFSRLKDDSQVEMASFDKYDLAAEYAWMAVREFISAYDHEHNQPNDKKENLTMPTLSPVDEFRKQLEIAGASPEHLNGHPIMDGQWHRVQEISDKSGGKAIAYKAYSDGVPNGVIENHRTNQKIKWKPKGYVLTTEAKSEIKKEAQIKLQKREREREEKNRKAISALSNMISKVASKQLTKTPYMEAKGIDIHNGTYRIGLDDNVLVVPLYDTSNELRSALYIQADGEKRFSEHTEKKGTFHVIGEGTSDCLADVPAIIISEGYSTAASITQSVGYPTVMAGNGANMVDVGISLREQHPNKVILFAADDDRHLEARKDTGHRNPGIQNAQAAAEAVGGIVVRPAFTNELREIYKDDPKQIKDFNDLANKHPEGASAVTRQMGQALKIASQLQVDQTVKRSNEQTKSLGLA